MIWHVNYITAGCLQVHNGYFQALGHAYGVLGYWNANSIVFLKTSYLYVYNAVCIIHVHTGRYVTFVST